MGNSGWTFLTIAVVIMVSTVVNTISAETCGGDTPGVVKDGNTCSELVSGANSECYNVTIETLCCASCAAVATGVTGCNYGDSATCHSFLCDGLIDPSVCCATCGTATTATASASTSTTTTPSTTSTTTTPSTTSSTTAAPTTSTTTPSTTSTTTPSTTSTTTPSTTSAATTSSTTSTTTPSTTSSTTTSPVTLSTITASTASAAASSGSGAAPSDGDDINEGAIIGGVFGGVTAALLILAAIVVGMKLYKRSKQKVEPSEESKLPPKPDLFSVPTRPELYSTPTMVVIDTAEEYPDESDKRTDKKASDRDSDNRINEAILAPKHAVNNNGPNSDRGLNHESAVHVQQDIVRSDHAGHEASPSYEKYGEDNSNKNGNSDGQMFEKRNTSIKEICQDTTAEGELEIEEINDGDDVANNHIVDVENKDANPAYRHKMTTVEPEKNRFTFPDYNA